MKIRILKFDPAVDPEPYYVENEVEYKDKMTLLEAIVSFHENFEAVAYDYSCHGRYCGRCAVMLDGVPSLACCTPLTDQSHTIEPLKGHTVIRDLIVDKRDFDDRISKVYARVRAEPIKPEDVNVFDATHGNLIYDLADCTRCSICDAACPVYGMMPDQFAGPATMVALAKRFYDDYDQGDRVLEAVSKGLYHCTLCGICDQVCPRPNILHVESFKAIRAEAEKRGLKPSYAD